MKSHVDISHLKNGDARYHVYLNDSIICTFREHERAAAISDALSVHDDLVAALERAFMTFGKFGGNHISDLYAQTVRSDEIRAAWEDARAALAKVSA